MHIRTNFNDVDAAEVSGVTLKGGFGSHWAASEGV
jgi:hypothetical protein